MDTNQENGSLCKFVVHIIEQTTDQFVVQTSPFVKHFRFMRFVQLQGGRGDIAEVACICSAMPFPPSVEAIAALTSDLRRPSEFTSKLHCNGDATLKSSLCLGYQHVWPMSHSYKLNKLPQKAWQFIIVKSQISLVCDKF